MSDERFSDSDLSAMLDRLHADPQNPRAGQRWRHVKSDNLCRVVCLSLKEDGLTPLVTYVSLSWAGLTFTRPLAQWQSRYVREG